MPDLELIGQGSRNKIYRDGGTAVKIYENDPAGAEREFKNQQFACDSGLPVPEVYGVRRLDGSFTALDMAYIKGRPLIHPEMNEDEQKNAIRALAGLQCTVHRVRANDLPKQTEWLARKIMRASLLNEALKTRLSVQLALLDNGAVSLCHDDFHSNNILYDGCKFWIIDWQDAKMGNPLSDACRTYLMLLEHMEFAAGIYLQAYCQESGAKPEAVLDWLPINAAARIDEAKDEKTKAWLLEIAKIS